MDNDTDFEESLKNGDIQAAVVIPDTFMLAIERGRKGSGDWN